MNYIPGSREFLAAHHYEVKRTGPLEYTVIDLEPDPGADPIVCRATSHAAAVKELLRIRFLD